MGAPARRILLRRVVAAALALLATVAAWLLLVREDDPDEAGRAQARGLSDEAAALVEGLSTEELVDQVLMLGFDGVDAGAPIAAELGERQLGAVLLRADNWPDAAQGSALAGELRSAGIAGGRIPPLIVASQEGGSSRPLHDLPPEESALEVGNAGSPAAAERWAAEAAGALREAGVDLNLFPVADVATLDSPLADRALSDDSQTVTALVAAAIGACEQAGLACAPAHFPGLGAASQDTAVGPATVGLDPASLDVRDLEPFRAAFAQGAPAVVLSLAFYSAYDPVTPAALTPSVATGLLRDDLGFDGVAITDDLGSGAVKATYRVPEAAVEALAAGADLIQLASPADQKGVREALLTAVEAGGLEADRLAEAAGRVIELKRELGLLGPA